MWEPKAPQQLGPFPLGMPCALSVDPLPPSAPGPQPGASAPLPSPSPSHWSLSLHTGSWMLVSQQPAVLPCGDRVTFRLRCLGVCLG